MKKVNLKPHIVIFVEGDTDKIFFEGLINFYRENSKTEIYSCEVRNLKGVSRYTSKVIGKLENEICPKAQKNGYIVKAVCCSYDTDVFEYSERPIVDWRKVKEEVKQLGIKEFCQIKVERMIEDWILDDLDGLCVYLNLKETSKLTGKDAFIKIQTLFKKAKKIYLKGSSIQKFIGCINFQTIRNCRKSQLIQLEKILNVKID